MRLRVGNGVGSIRNLFEELPDERKKRGWLAHEYLFCEFACMEEFYKEMHIINFPKTSSFVFLYTHSIPACNGTVEEDIIPCDLEMLHVLTYLRMDGPCTICGSLSISHDVSS